MRIPQACLSIVMLSAVGVAQDFTVSVPSAVTKTIGKILPERSNTGSAFISESFSSSLQFAGTGTARIIFVHEGAGYQNTLGYFTYTDAGGVVSITSANLLIPNATMPSVVERGYGYDLRDAAGNIRTFAAGEKLGFFLIANGNRSASSIVSGWTFDYSDSLGKVPDPDPNVNRQRGLGLYTSLSDLNPENLYGQPDKARHLALVNIPGVTGFLGDEDFFVVGFEDLRRDLNSDEDFNDLVFIVEVTPFTALSVSGVYTYTGGDPDGDGVTAPTDAYPTDGERVLVERTPSHGFNVIAYEDQYPLIGDADYNDAVLAYVYEVVKNSNGDVKDIVATFALTARGASYEHQFCLHIPGLPANATGTIDLEHFVSGSTVGVQRSQRSVADMVAAGNRIDDVVESTTALLPPSSGDQFSNTEFASPVLPAGLARVRISFDTAISPSVLGRPPYDPVLLVENPTYPNTLVDIHLSGKAPFPNRIVELPVESGEQTFKDARGFPYALEIPNSWRFPMEKTSVESGYSQFFDWRFSAGQNNRSWYDFPVSTNGQVGPVLSEIVPSPNWTVGLPSAN